MESYFFENDSYNNKGQNKIDSIMFNPYNHIITQMKLTKFAVALSLVTLSLLTSCGPNTINTPVEVTNLTLSPATTTMLEGETLQLVATTTPAGAKVTYTIDKSSVATVSESGLVKALTPGTAIVTAQAGDKKSTCTITVVKASEVMLINKIDQKKYVAGSTIDYKVSASKEKAESYDLQLDFSVRKTANYNFSLSFAKETSGTVCLGSCEAFENQTSFKKDIKLTADEEEVPYEKEKGATTPISTHIDIPNPIVGQTYTNTITITLTPKAGGEPLVWTVNLTVTII